MHAQQAVGICSRSSISQLGLDWESIQQKTCFSPCSFDDLPREYESESQTICLRMPGFGTSYSYPECTRLSSFGLGLRANLKSAPCGSFLGSSFQALGGGKLKLQVRRLWEDLTCCEGLWDTDWSPFGETTSGMAHFLYLIPSSRERASLVPLAAAVRTPVVSRQAVRHGMAFAEF